MKKLMTIDEAAKILVVHTRTIRRLIAAGEIEALKVRSSLRVTVDSIRHFQRRQIAQYQADNGILPNIDDESVTTSDRM